MQSAIDDGLSNLIGLIYEASIDPGFWPTVLEELTKATPGIAAVLYSFDQTKLTSTLHKCYGISEDHLREQREKWSSNPVIDATNMIDPGDVSGLEPLIDFNEFRKHPFYLEWGSRERYCDSINVMLERTPTRFSSISVITNDDQGLATDAMIQRLKILAPHFMRAVRIGRVLDHATLKEQAIVQTLDALASAIFLLNAAGDVVHANASAQDLIDKGVTIADIKTQTKKLGTANDGLTIVDDRKAPDEGVFTITTKSGERCVCHALPLGFATMSLPQTGPLTLVVIQNATSTDAATKVVAQQFGLTNREREVLFGLVEVGGITPVSTLLDLSKATIKSHVKAVFLKTRTRRQFDLVRLVGDFITPFA